MCRGGMKLRRRCSFCSNFASLVCAPFPRSVSKQSVLKQATDLDRFVDSGNEKTPELHGI